MNEMHPMGDRQQGQKSSRGKGKYKPKGRMLDPIALAEVQGLLGKITPQRDMLIEYLHVIQDARAERMAGLCPVNTCTLQL